MRYYHWAYGYQYLVSKKKLPWENLWYNDKAVFYWNIPVNTSLGKPRSNEYSWLRDLLGGLRTSWAANIQLESPDQYINHEFLGIDVQTKKTDLYIPDEPAYGMVSIERAPRVNPNIKKATIVCPTQNQLEAYAIDQKGGTPGDTYTNLRLKQRPVADDENRKITRWTTMADTIGLNVKRDT